MTSSTAGQVRPVPLPAGERPRPASWPVAGFVVLLGLLFTLAYAVGGFAGPVAPGMRPSDGGGPGRSGPAEPGGMGGMHGMGGIGDPVEGAERGGSR
ncbi:hypothetical protein HUF15_14625 [Streptomyces samsunensis]|uniref:hypothetical protein n=1 Tax=Streptomyces malaysiensis TaxID=92644 RepID=UPI000BFBD2F0|nr:MULTISPECIES: hypothetical protein [Streptomyces]NUH37985.1 hypothetical protein [Streptomyces samsunensis]QDL68993.1 hypothetical protein DNK48_05805 [Streptomyces malaysiensis]